MKPKVIDEKLFRVTCRDKIIKKIDINDFHRHLWLHCKKFNSKMRHSEIR